MEEDSAITFESLYNIVRNEKTSEDIQKLSPELYGQIISYLKTKIRTYKEARAKGLKESERIKTHIISARKLIKDLYEKREKKILVMALNKSRVKQANDENLSNEEKALLNELANILDKYRKSILLELLNARLPKIMPDKNNSKNPEGSNKNINENKAKETINESHKDSGKPNAFKESPETRDPKTRKESEPIAAKAKTKKIQFTKEVPSFFGKSLEVLGPYSPGDVAELDAEIAELIIKKNYAKEII